MYLTALRTACLRTRIYPSTTLEIMNLGTMVSLKTNPNIYLYLAVIFFTEMLGPEEEGKISHVTEIEISERSMGKKLVDEGPPEKWMTYI